MPNYFSFKRTFAIIKKEFSQLKRDRSTLAMIVVLPIILLMVFGYAINSDPKNLKTVVISRDNSQFSRSFVTALKNSEYFKIEREISSDKEGKDLLQKGEVQFVITIPENFAKNLIRGDRPSLLIEADATDPIATAGAIGSVQGIMSSIMKRDLIGPLAFTQSVLPPFQVNVQKLYNPEGITHYNIVPGLIGVVLTMTCIMMTALALTKETERGTMENLLAMPVKPIEVMIGKITPYIFIGYIQSSIIIFLAKFLFHVPILGSIYLLFAVLIIFIICNLSLGFAISTIAKNQTQALQMSVMMIVPSILLSGFIFPFQGMPAWAQGIGSCMPMTYFIRIVRSIMLKGSHIIEIWGNIWPLLIFMLIVTLITVKIYKRTLD